MSNYIDENYYYNTFGGKLIPAIEIEKYATRASNRVRNNIFNRSINGFENEVQNATCSVAEILYNQYLNLNKLNNVLCGKEKQITSEKVGDYSRNISNVSIDELKKFSSNEYINEQIESVLEENLLVTGLLYPGVSYV